MTEAEAHLWLENLRTCLEADRAEMNPAVLTTFVELLRFLWAAHCPQKDAEAQARLRWTCPDCGSAGYPSTHVCHE